MIELFGDIKGNTPADIAAVVSLKENMPPELRHNLILYFDEQFNESYKIISSIEGHAHPVMGYKPEDPDSKLKFDIMVNYGKLAEQLRDFLMTHCTK